jgi:hypothetical protein
MGSGLRESSVLLPVPRMTLGASLLRRKSSISVLAVLVMLLLRVDGVRSRLSDVVPALADRPILAALTELPLRPLTAYLPYPSWPVPATGPFRWSLFSGFVKGAGSVFVRRLKKPNLAILLGLGAGTCVGSVLDLRPSRSLCTSGVGPRVDTCETGSVPDIGPGDGIREGAFVGTPILDFAAGPCPILDSVELVRLCIDGNAIMLLWITGDGPRNPISSGVPSRLGLAGRRMGGSETGD